MDDKELLQYAIQVISSVISKDDVKITLKDYSGVQDYTFFININGVDTNINTVLTAIIKGLKHVEF